MDGAHRLPENNHWAVAGTRCSPSLSQRVFLFISFYFIFSSFIEKGRMDKTFRSVDGVEGRVCLY